MLTHPAVHAEGHQSVARSRPNRAARSSGTCARSARASACAAPFPCSPGVTENSSVTPLGRETIGPGTPRDVDAPTGHGMAEFHRATHVGRVERIPVVALHVHHGRIVLEGRVFAEDVASAGTPPRRSRSARPPPSHARSVPSSPCRDRSPARSRRSRCCSDRPAPASRAARSPRRSSRSARSSLVEKRVEEDLVAARHRLDPRRVNRGSERHASDQRRRIRRTRGIAATQLHEPDVPARRRGWQAHVRSGDPPREIARGRCAGVRMRTGSASSVDGSKTPIPPTRRPSRSCGSVPVEEARQRSRLTLSSGDRARQAADCSGLSNSLFEDASTRPGSASTRVPAVKWTTSSASRTNSSVSEAASKRTGSNRRATMC
jgi:hypothetical protein